MSVSDYIVDGEWNLPTYFHVKDDVLTNKILQTTLPIKPVPDALQWLSTTDGHLTNKLTYLFVRGTCIKVPWHKLVWNTYIPPTRVFICWRFIHNRLPTDENLRKRGCTIVSICCFCKKQLETSDHIFLRCPVTSQIWDWLNQGINQQLDLSSCQNLFVKQNWRRQYVGAANSDLNHQKCHMVHMVREK